MKTYGLTKRNKNKDKKLWLKEMSTPPQVNKNNPLMVHIQFEKTNGSFLCISVLV
jgi:hypothetical protein